ncbi:2',3'-cyclic-nucleotide 3'-phosphodiesterase, partial [Melanogaster broomeanus]
GLSLWLVPSPEQINLIQSVLPKRPSHPLASDHNLSPHSYPTIRPHITLASVSVPNDALAGPSEWNALFDAVPAHQHRGSVRANFQSLVVDDHYFRSVLVDIQRTQDLVDLQSQIATNLSRSGLEPRAPRFPHVSLCYITDEDVYERERAAQMLRNTGIVTESQDAQSISLRCGVGSLSGFDGEEIWAVKCEGPVETWEVHDRKVQLNSMW